MADNSTVIAISAFSGLAGSVLTQGISGTIAYFSDKRKQRNDVKTCTETRSWRPAKISIM